MYKNHKMKFALMAALMFLLFAALCVTGFAYTDTENVAYVDGTYTVTGAETTEQGKSPDFPFTVLSDAYKSLYETGGTVVVCGRTMTDSGFTSVKTVMHTTPIYFTSTFKGTDYASENDARIVMYSPVHFHGDVTFENITFISKNYCFIHGNGHKLIFGEDIKVELGTAADENYTDKDTGDYIDSTRYLDIRGGGEGVAYDGDLYLEFNSGLFSAIHAGTKRYSVGGDVNLIINTLNITEANLGNDVATDADGNIYTGAEYLGNVNVSVNSGGNVKFNLKYIDKVSGSINIALNNGSDCVTSYTIKPEGGTRIVTADGYGTVENLGGGYFRAVADDGYVAVVPSGAEEITITDTDNQEVTFSGSYAQTFKFKAAEGDTTVHFIDRSNKPAPVGVYTIPASDEQTADGELRGTSSAMEYRLQGADDFISITSSTVTGLYAGTYEVRYKAEESYAAGEIGTYTVSGRGAEYVIAEALAKREAKIAKVRSATSSLDTSAYNNVYYVSTSGSDSNAGTSDSSPLATLSAANSKAVSGDLILLKRDDIWRERLTMVSGVDYSSYGDASLDMPFIYGSPENGADSSKWTLVEGTDNIWQYATTLTDVGVIVFNDGAENSIKEIPDYYNGTYYVRGSGATEEFDILTHLDNDLEHFNLYTGTQKSVYLPAYDGNTTLYLRCDRGNPGEVFSSIEFNTKGHVVTNASNCCIDNIGLKYGGYHGIGGSNASDFTVTNCEIGWIGGCVQYYAQVSGCEYGRVTRFGNGIEIWQNCDGFTVDNCYVYQCYDAGLTHQGRASDTSTGAVKESYMKDVTYSNNLLEYNVYNIEYFLSNLADEEDYTAAGFSFPMMTDINYTGNLCFYAGYGFGKQRPDAGRMSHINGWTHDNPATNFTISGNTFFDSVDYVANMGATKQDWLPTFSDNIYIQKRGTYGAYYGATSSMALVTFDDGIQDFYNTSMGDAVYEVIFLEVLENIPHAVTVEDESKLYVVGLDGYTEISFDNGETWILPETSVAEFSIDELGDYGIIARAASRGNDSKESESIQIEIVPEFGKDSSDQTVITEYNPIDDGSVVYFPQSAMSLSEDFEFDVVPTTAYIVRAATSLKASLEDLGVNVIYYPDTDIAGAFVKISGNSCIESSNEETGFTYSSAAKISLYKVPEDSQNESAVLYDEYSEPADSAEATVTFAFEDVYDGSYYIVIEKNGYVEYKSEAFDVAGTDIDLGNITLIPGDIKGAYEDFDGDAAVDIDDLIRIIRASIDDASSELVTISDINEDGDVQMDDFALVKDNLGKTSASYSGQ